MTVPHMQTPSYVFDIGEFRRRIAAVKSAIPDVQLVYSIKANPFLIDFLPDETEGIEACSPGELAICIRHKVRPESIIYSGVMKEAEDVEEALEYGVTTFTAESRSQYELIRKSNDRHGRDIDLLLRLSSGNQFGMSAEDIISVILDAKGRSGLRIKGLHYYSGTAGREAKVEADIKKLDKAVEEIRDKTGSDIDFLEYGPGMAAECFLSSDADCEKKDMDLLDAVAPMIRKLGERYTLGIEMGRFFATSCGTYRTCVKDIKTTDGVNYLIVDGGTHHLKYHGQNMAMKLPVLLHEGAGEPAEYTICGSLCTTADVLVRNTTLNGVKPGDILRFRRCGAYSVTESPVLFLSRKMPAVYVLLDSEEKMLRDAVDTGELNS